MQKHSLPIRLTLVGLVVCSGTLLLSQMHGTAWDFGVLLAPAFVSVILICLWLPRDSTEFVRQSDHVPVPTSVGMGAPVSSHTPDLVDHSDAGSTAGPLQLGGLWEGTARWWPDADASDESAIPIQVCFSEDSRRAELLASGVDPAGERIVSVNVLEYDGFRGDLDLSVATSRHGTALCDQHIAQLVFKDGRLVPEDETETFTLALRRVAF